MVDMPRGLALSIVIAFAAAGMIVFIIRDLEIPWARPHGRRETVKFLVGCTWIVAVVAIVCLVGVESSMSDSPLAALFSDFFGP
jgi:threonine/homoserine/homoserine lactone efflux protein